MGEPSIAIRVGQAENGADACKEERGPRVGFVEPVTELREIQIKYKRFNGSSTIFAAPTTNSSGTEVVPAREVVRRYRSKECSSCTRTRASRDVRVQKGSDQP